MGSWVDFTFAKLLFVNQFLTLFDRVDEAITGSMRRTGIPLIRISLGVVFLWFGALKFFPGLSPAEALVGQTISVMTSGLIPPKISVPMVALWECLIGIGFLTGYAQRLTILLLYLQMPGTLMPLFFFPEATFTRFPYAPTLEGQYIIKNIVLMSAALAVGATVRDTKPR